METIMKFKKTIITFVVGLASSLLTLYLLKLIHGLVFSVTGILGLGFIAYDAVLFLTGGWLLIRYGSRFAHAEKISAIVIISIILGIGVGITIEALIGASMLWMLLT